MTSQNRLLGLPRRTLQNAPADLNTGRRQDLPRRIARAAKPRRAQRRKLKRRHSAENAKHALAMDHGPIGEENEDPMDVDAPPSPAAAEPSPDATRPSPMDSDDSDDNDITLDQMREKARFRREASPEALREADQASRMERLKKQRERDARFGTQGHGAAHRQEGEGRGQAKLKELTRQKSALENELRKAREGGVSRSLLPSPRSTGTER